MWQGALAPGPAFHVRYGQWRRGTIVSFPRGRSIVGCSCRHNTVCVYQHWQPLVR